MTAQAPAHLALAKPQPSGSAGEVLAEIEAQRDRLHLWWHNLTDDELNDIVFREVMGKAGKRGAGFRPVTRPTIARQVAARVTRILGLGEVFHRERAALPHMLSKEARTCIAAVASARLAPASAEEASHE